MHVVSNLANITSNPELSHLSPFLFVSGIGAILRLQAQSTVLESEFLKLLGQILCMDSKGADSELHDRDSLVAMCSFSDKSLVVRSLCSGL